MTYKCKQVHDDDENVLCSFQAMWLIWLLKLLKIRGSSANKSPQAQADTIKYFNIASVVSFSKISSRNSQILGRKDLQC